MRAAARALAVAALVAGAAWRALLVARWAPVYRPDVPHEEGYYEAGVTLLSCAALAQVPDVRPTAFRAPLFPALLAAVEAPFSRPSPAHARWALLFLQLLSLALIYCLARCLVSPAAGLAAAALAALEPTLVGYAPSLNVHLVYGLLLLFAAAAGAVWARGLSSRWAAAFGFCCGAALLCRSAHYPLPVLFAALALAWSRSRRQALSQIGFFAAGVAAAFAPVLLRNALLFHRFQPFDYKGAYILLRGTAGPYDITTVDQALQTADALSPGFSARALSGHALYDALIALALRNMAAHPLRFLWYCVQRFFGFWSGLWPWLAAAAVALWRRPKDRALWAVAAVAASLSGYALAGGAAEYRVTALPVLCVLAGAAVGELLRAGASGERPGRWAAAAAGAPVLLWAAMTLLLGREVRAQRGPAAGVCDDRAAELLELSYAQAPGDRAPERQDYVRQRERSLLSLLAARDGAGAAGEAQEALRAAPRDAELRRMRELALSGSAAPGVPDWPTGPMASLKAADALKTQAAALFRAGDERGALALLLSRRQEMRAAGPAAEAEALAAAAVLEWTQASQDQARADFSRAVTLSAARACEEGLSAFDRSRAPRAFLDACGAYWPDDPKWLLDRGIAAYLDGDAAAAAGDMRRALALKPGFLEAALSLSTVLRGQGRGAEASRVVSDALAAAGPRADRELVRRARAEVKSGVRSQL